MKYYILLAIAAFAAWFLFMKKSSVDTSDASTGGLFLKSGLLTGGSSSGSSVSDSSGPTSTATDSGTQTSTVDSSGTGSVNPGGRHIPDDSGFSNISNRKSAFV